MVQTGGSTDAPGATARDAAVDTRTGFVRELGKRDGVALVVGTVIGSGIYLVPGPIALQLHSLGPVLLAWIVGGLLSISGALSLGELGSMYPGAGGLYVYLRHAFGRPVAFLYGWGLLSMIQTGSIATLAAGFGLYVSRLFPVSNPQQRMIEVACIVALSAINCFGVHLGKLVQNISTGAKLLGLASLFVLLVVRGHASVLEASFSGTELHGRSIVPFGAALVAVLWAYEGWHAVSFAAGEFRAPRRDLPFSLFVGTTMVAGIYVLLNIAYYSVLTPGAIASSDHAAATAISSAYGTGMTAMISVLILTSILGAMNGLVLTGPRVYYAMGRDGVFFRGLGKTDSRFHAPILATAIQCVWACVLTLAGSFQQLFTYVIFTAWIFYGLTVAAVIVLRRRSPEVKRNFRVPGYPWPPILFVLAALGITLNTLVASPLHALLGIAMILSGIPLYLYFRWYERAKGAA